jgi:hypothetical protein
MTDTVAAAIASSISTNWNAGTYAKPGTITSVTNYMDASNSIVVKCRSLGSEYIAGNVLASDWIVSVAMHHVDKDAITELVHCINDHLSYSMKTYPAAAHKDEDIKGEHVWKITFEVRVLS